MRIRRDHGVRVGRNQGNDGKVRIRWGTEKQQRYGISYHTLPSRQSRPLYNYSVLFLGLIAVGCRQDDMPFLCTVCCIFRSHYIPIKPTQFQAGYYTTVISQWPLVKVECSFHRYHASLRVVWLFAFIFTRWLLIVGTVVVCVVCEVYDVLWVSLWALRNERKYRKTTIFKTSSFFRLLTKTALMFGNFVELKSEKSSWEWKNQIQPFVLGT